MSESDSRVHNATQVVGDRDSFVLRPTPWAGGASDLGLRHVINQDALAIAAGGDQLGENTAVVTLSDGVSTSEYSEFAAKVAADSACQTLAAALDTVDRRPENLAVAMVDAFITANAEVVMQAGPNPGISWACTLICVAVTPDQVLVGNAGDSRCYWIDDDGNALLLSADDSVAAARMRAGMSREEAESGADAHAITKWLGPGALDIMPSIQTFDLVRPGWILACSDGLWNYASSPREMAELLHGFVSKRSDAGLSEAAMVSSKLVEWAKSNGGRDNISVGLVRVPME
ncbi:MAG: serine/threonine-protein phosphatase [Propionibacteriaceae bacterium]|jgi:serine/threonine protein phosphatase PrpC|nr:serine/threonine-protein phosphatase [Propionibacteriaceae bacterium]